MITLVYKLIFPDLDHCADALGIDIYFLVQAVMNSYYLEIDNNMKLGGLMRALSVPYIREIT